MVSAVIVAGGKGKRMGRGINKQYIKLGGEEIILKTLNIFQSIEDIHEIVLVLPEKEIDEFKNSILNKDSIKKLHKIVPGGEERQQSVYNGISACSPDCEIIAIHDGARPFVTRKIVLDTIEYAEKYGACAAGVPVKDTIKFAENGIITDTPDRARLFAIQTPQTFKRDIIIKAHEKAIRDGILATDDTMLVERIGHSVRITEGSYYNIKITTPEDLVIGEAINNYMA